jgi:hypothetical protein
LQFRVRNYSFTLSEPYAEGQTLTAGEARVLNTVRAERIREQITRRVIEVNKPLPGQLPTLLTQQQLADLQSEVDGLSEQFEFTAPIVPLSVPVGTVENEARKISEQRIDSESRRAGIELTAQAREELITSDLSSPTVQHEARRRIGLRQAIAQKALEELL